MNDALTALYALQQVDSALVKAQRQYQALDPGQAEKEAAEQARARAERISHEYHETLRNLHDAELELKSVEAKKKECESKLYGGKITVPKEMAAMQQEIEALGRQRGRLDERVLTLMDAIETQKGEEAETKAALEAAEAALAKKQSEYRTLSRQLAAKIQNLQQRRTEMISSIPAPLLKRYEAIRSSHGGVGIARVEGGLCGACHTSLSSNVIRAIETTATVETCENCGRLLCVVAETTE
jgi:hypothetical protein